MRDGGASMVMMDMRYMWSEMDSPFRRPMRRQPSRLVVLRRVRRWKKGIGVSGLGGGGAGRVVRTVVVGVRDKIEMGYWGEVPD